MSLFGTFHEHLLDRRMSRTSHRLDRLFRTAGEAVQIAGDLRQRVEPLLPAGLPFEKAQIQ